MLRSRIAIGFLGLVLGLSLGWLALVTAGENTSSGWAIVHLGTTLTCEDQTHTVCRVESQFGYETIAASQTDQAMGATGATGDLLHSVVCEMSAASVGVVTIKDGGGSAINIIEAQAAAAHVTVAFDMVSTSGAWKISTGTNTTCIGIGRFT